MQQGNLLMAQGLKKVTAANHLGFLALNIYAIHLYCLV